MFAAQLWQCIPKRSQARKQVLRRPLDSLQPPSGWFNSNLTSYSKLMCLIVQTDVLFSVMLHRLRVQMQGSVAVVVVFAAEPRLHVFLLRRSKPDASLVFSQLGLKVLIGTCVAVGSITSSPTCLDSSVRDSPMCSTVGKGPNTSD